MVDRARRGWYALWDRWAVNIFMSTVMMLLLLGFARIYTITTDLRHAQSALRREQHDACELRRRGRANTNLHDRVPLRAALQYLGDAVEGSAAHIKDPVRRYQTLAFAHRFQAYARAVEPLSNPKC